MRRLFLLCLTVPALLLAQDALPKAEDVLDRYVEATGGKAAYEKIRNELASGQVEFVGRGIRGTLTLYQARPDSSYVVMDLAGVGKIEQGTQGGVAWERSALQGPRVKKGPERAAALREADLLGRVQWRTHYRSAECTGVETVDGKPAFRVVMTPKDGSPETRYFDKESGLLVRADRVVKSPMGEIQAQTLWSDYRLVDGILTPHRLRQKAMNQEILTTIESIRFNSDIPESRFALPEDVKALVAADNQ